MPTTHNKFMSQALKLASLSGRDTAPNPMVGAIIIKNGKIIGKGYHKKFGGPHAEVNAIKSVKNKKNLVGATIYVTLEPCRHHGKTPACLGLIEKVGISKIICGSRDPFQQESPMTNDQCPISFLRGTIADKCKQLNKFYFKWITKKLPYITAKIAISTDGFVAGKGGKPIHITSKAQDIKIHKLRAQHQAIMVGSNTVLTDNPHLGVRLTKGKDPLRIILDVKNKVPKKAKVFRDKNYLHINKKTTLKKLFKELGKKGISSILVEPGPTLFRSLKKQNLIDELVVFVGKKKIKEGLTLNN